LYIEKKRRQKAVQEAYSTFLLEFGKEIRAAGDFTVAAGARRARIRSFNYVRDRRAAAGQACPAAR